MILHESDSNIAIKRSNSHFWIILEIIRKGSMINIFFFFLYPSTIFFCPPLPINGMKIRWIGDFSGLERGVQNPCIDHPFSAKIMNEGGRVAR